MATVILWMIVMVVLMVRIVVIEVLLVLADMAVPIDVDCGMWNLQFWHWNILLNEIRRKSDYSLYKNIQSHYYTKEDTR